MGTLWKSVLAVSLLLVVPLAARSAAPPPLSGAGAAKTGVISGQLLTSGGEPLAGGMVYFFNTAVGPPPAHDKYWRIPDFSILLDSEGKFSIALPEGEYCLSATRRVAGKAIGPPREGDYYFISTDEKGLPVIYSVKGNAQVDLGRVAGAVPFRSDTVNYGKGITAIEGFIFDSEGKPVAGAFVLAFVSVKSGRPLFISDPTGKDGSFVLRVHDGGSYYLKVRSMYGGGPPATGELVGIYGDKQPAVLTVKKGERLTGLTIKMTKFAGRGPQRGAK